MIDEDSRYQRNKNGVKEYVHTLMRLRITLAVLPVIFLLVNVFFQEAFGTNGGARSKCCVTSFNAPTNRTGQRDGHNADGTVYLYEHFEVTAEFSSTEPCECSCCEYRQYIRGSWWYDGNLQTLDLVDPNDTTRRIQLSPDTFHEDYRDYSGSLVRCGHRGEAGPATESYTNADGTTNRAGGCHYRLVDEPGWKGAADGHCYRAEFTFRGEIISTCEGGCEGCASQEWTVNLEENF